MQVSFTCVQSKGYTIGRVYISKHLLLGIFPIKNPEKIAHGAFLLLLNIVNVTINYRFTSGRALPLFLCSYVCALSG